MQTYLCQVSQCRKSLWFGPFLQWKICLQRVISGLFLRMVHQSIKGLCRHVQTLRKRVQRVRSQELLDVFAVPSANVSHPGICVAISIGIHIARSKLQWELTIRPCRQRKRYHLRVNFHQACLLTKVPQLGSDSKVFPVLQCTHVLSAPSSQSMLVGDGSVVRLHVEIDFGHLDPSPWP